MAVAEYVHKSLNQEEREDNDSQSQTRGNVMDETAVATVVEA